MIQEETNISIEDPRTSTILDFIDPIESDLFVPICEFWLEFCEREVIKEYNSNRDILTSFLKQTELDILDAKLQALWDEIDCKVPVGLGTIIEVALAI